VRYAKALKFKVIAVDIDDGVLEHAKEGGADHTINTKSNQDFLGQIYQLTSGGLDAVAVFTAVKEGFDIAPRMLRTGGKLVIVGCPPNEISFNATEIALNRYSIAGASNHATKERLIECAEFTQKHNIEPPIRSFHIDQVEEMINIMQTGKLGGNRLVVVY
jgi:D-arabinose 1-dehydrogenase-like Zn-dependent alcohol dehydrogenase